ncbi:uncharacterized protein LOC127008878 [Eriocheir sinensis]|uniref:uncharacterized protein LOC127008878 n=1 Tax=Eriocheir sinensis TaxID=95602 RepID=UPI0021C63943|nr:uncharacterized protein LOC127008878 [Eriocheir sinensis]
MSQRGTRPRSWCPRGDSPLRVPEGGNLPSPVAAPGLQGLPPAVASPRSTPTPFKLRRLSMGTERSGSPCTAPPSAATVLPALHMAAAQLEQQQQQQRQAAQHAAAQVAQQGASNMDQTAAQLSHSGTPLPQQQQQQQQQFRNIMQSPRDGRPQSGVFYPVPQHPASPPPLAQHKDLQRTFRNSPILLRDSSVEPRSPPSSRPSSVAFREREPRSPPASRPSSVVFRERDTWSPTPSSRPTSAMSRDQDYRYPSLFMPRDRDPRSPPPMMKPSPLLQSDRDFRSPTPSRPFPFRQKERSSASPGSSTPRPRPTSLHLPGTREPWSPSRPSPLAQRDRDPLSPPTCRPSPLAYERDLFSPPSSRPASLILNNKGTQSPRSPLSPRPFLFSRRGSAGTPLSMFSFPGPDGDLQPSTQELIDRQGQDFVDERLAEFQAQIHQLQGEY